MKRAIISAVLLGTMLMAVSAVSAAPAFARCRRGPLNRHLWLTRKGNTCEKMAPDEHGEDGHYYVPILFGAVLATGEQCDEVETGEASDYASEASCVNNEAKEGTGGWERAEVEPPEFLNSSGEPISSTTFTGTAGAGKLSGNGEVIECSGGSSRGDVNSSTTVNSVLVLYSGCKDLSSGLECHSSNEASGSGIILTNELSGKLGLISGGSGVGLLLAPGSGTEFVKISSTHCAASTINVKGSIIGEVLPVGKLVLTGELNYAANGSSQDIQGFNGTSVHELLTAFGTLLSGLNDNNTITFGEEVEVS